MRVKKQVFALGEWTAPPGVTHVILCGCGGGGGGGASTVVELAPGAKYSVEIGKGGTGGRDGGT